MEDNSRISKNDGYRLRIQNRSVVHKANLSTTYTKKSLRANNRALARALSRKKQELSALNNNYVKLLGETNLLRLHLQGCDMEMSKFYAEKFTQFKNTVSNAAQLLHSVCGQLIDISANFEYASEFFQNLQSISLSKPSTLTPNIAPVRRPAQRVAMNQNQDSFDVDENTEEENKECNVERCLELIEEEPSQITEQDESTIYDEDEEKENEIIQNSINNSFNLNSSITTNNEVSPMKTNLSPLTRKSAIQITQQGDECPQVVDEHVVKPKIVACRKKSIASKPGHMKYNAAKPTTDNSDKLKFKSLSASQPLKTSDEINVTETLNNALNNERSNINPTKDKQMAIYDISLDDSSYIAPPISQQKGQIVHPVCHEKQNKQIVPEATRAEESKKEMEESAECLNEPRGIMLRLGNGARTKPKDKSKSVRYTEDEASMALAAAPVPTSSAPNIVLQNDVEYATPLPQISRPEPEKGKDAGEQFVSISEFNQPKSSGNEDSDKVNERKDSSEKDFHLKNLQDIKTETSELMDSLDSRCSDGNPRKRRAASNVNYKEPSLNSKLRKGDPHTFTVYPDNPVKKRGKKSAS